jgi:rod shape-determining protein MreD
MVWLVFAGFVAVLTAAEYAARAVLDLAMLPPAPILAQGIVTILIYPLLAVALIRAHRGAAAPEQA